MTNLKYFLIFALILLVFIPVVDGSITSLNETHGETWIRWTWALEVADYGSLEMLTVYVDGASVGSYNLSSTPDALVPTTYLLSDVNPNEEHGIQVTLLDISVVPATVADQQTNDASTSLSTTYFYVVLGLALLLFLISLVVKMDLIKIFMDVGSVILLGYLTITTYGSNPAFSTISILLIIIVSIPIIYTLFKAYESSQNWTA